MKTFTDANGREWRVEIRLGEVERIQDVAGIDFGDLKNLFENMAKALGDTRTFGKILWALVGDQVEAKGLDAAQFKAGFNGDTVRDAAEAIAEEFVRFFPSAAEPILRLGAAVRARAKAARPAALAAMERATAEIEAGTKDRELGLLNTVTDSPESAAS